MGYPSAFSMLIMHRTGLDDEIGKNRAGYQTNSKEVSEIIATFIRKKG